MIISLIVVFVLFMLDQGTKYLAELYAPMDKEQVIIPNVLGIKKVYNTGAGWNLFANATWLLVLISVIATVVLTYYLIKNDWKKEKFRSFTICLIWAGCVGNLYDRIVSVLPLTKAARPGVVDMISWKWFDFFTELVGAGTTIFNVADFFLVTGIIFLVIYVIISEVKTHVKNNSK